MGQQQELLVGIASLLEDAGVPYFVTGSIASSLHGEPRTTHGVDLVVSVDSAFVASVVARFPPPRYYLDPVAAQEAVVRRDMFNLIDSLEGDKADFWISKTEPFETSCMSRRVWMNVFGMDIWIASSEDTILAKLRWTRMLGGSERQMRDAMGVYEVQRPGIDEVYLTEWAGRIGVADLLDKVRAEAKPLM